MAAIDARTLAILGGARVEGEVSAPVFFDSETTSLSSGAGCYVFLAGFASSIDGAIVVDQVFLCDPAGEGAFLEEVGARVRSAQLVVSFAGRGFDERRLEDRFRFVRMPSPFRRDRHADLLPISRALWKGRLDSCSLGALESAVLGYRREGDIPGEACPDAWFRSVRGDLSAREAVLRHNLLDLLSTAVLAVEVAAIAGGARQPAETLGLALHERRRGRADRALSLLGEAEVGSEALRPRERRTLDREAAALLKKAGRWEEAAARWRALANDPRPCVEALVELAKYAEHRIQDLSLAARAAAEALSLLRRGQADVPPRRGATLEVDLVGRLARIEARLASAGRRPSGGAPFTL